MKHAVVWIDHQEARILEVNGETIDYSIVTAPGPHLHRHANEQEMRVRNHPEDQHRFFHQVAQALEGHGQILIVGPSKTKVHFLHYVQQRERGLAPRIVGIEAADHPTDAQLVAHLRRHFHESSPRHGVEA
jgi:stalled ribosome rescue protein Dom34